MPPVVAHILTIVLSKFQLSTLSQIETLFQTTVTVLFYVTGLSNPYCFNRFPCSGQLLTRSTECRCYCSISKSCVFSLQNWLQLLTNREQPLYMQMEQSDVQVLICSDCICNYCYLKHNYYLKIQALICFGYNYDVIQILNLSNLLQVCQLIRVVKLYFIYLYAV